MYGALAAGGTRPLLREVGYMNSTLPGWHLGVQDTQYSGAPHQSVRRRLGLSDQHGHSRELGGWPLWQLCLEGGWCAAPQNGHGQSDSRWASARQPRTMPKAKTSKPHLARGGPSLDTCRLANTFWGCNDGLYCKDEAHLAVALGE